MFSRRAHHTSARGAEPHSRPHGSECSQHIFDDKVGAAGAPTISHRQPTSFGRNSACGAGDHRYQVPHTGLSPFPHAPKQIHSMAMKEDITRTKMRSQLAPCPTPRKRGGSRGARWTCRWYMDGGKQRARGAASASLVVGRVSKLQR
jgi:hypothetical protein